MASAIRNSARTIKSSYDIVLYRQQILVTQSNQVLITNFLVVKNVPILILSQFRQLYTVIHNVDKSQANLLYYFM